MSKDWFVYMLLCDEKNFYVGISDNLKARLLQHKNKQSFYTKQFSYLQLVYCEKRLSKYQAASREKQIKGWSHAKKQRLIKGELEITLVLSFAEVLLVNDLYL